MNDRGMRWLTDVAAVTEVKQLHKCPRDLERDRATGFKEARVASLQHGRNKQEVCAWL